MTEKETPFWDNRKGYLLGAKTSACGRGNLPRPFWQERRLPRREISFSWGKKPKHLILFFVLLSGFYG